MAIEILMPALSPTMEEGTLAKWMVKEGDVVAAGDIIAEIETDKATMEFEAVDEGIIGQIIVAEGSENVKVNSPIATILAEGEPAAAQPSAAPPAPSQAKAPAPAAVPAAAPAKAATAALAPNTAPDWPEGTTLKQNGARGFARRDGRGNAARSKRIFDGRRSRRISRGL